MRFATLQGEQNLADVVGRLFQIKGRRAKTLAKEAEVALLRANPHLHDLKKVPEGTLIIVPEVAGLKLAEEIRPVEAAAGEMVQEVSRELGTIRAALEAAATRHTAEANNTLQLLKSRELRALARRVPAVQERLPKITTEANARLEEAKALKIFQEQTLAQLDKDLKDLVQLFS